MKSKKIISLMMSILMLSSVALTGCSDEDWDEEYDETSISESDKVTEDDNEDKDTQDNNNNASDDKIKLDMSNLSSMPSSKDAKNGESDNMKTGAVEMKITTEMDANPTRAVRRNMKPIEFTPGTMIDGTPLNEDFYLFRNTLDPYFQKIYDAIRNGLINKQEVIDMPVPASPEDVKFIYNGVFNDDPNFFYVELESQVYQNNDGVATYVYPIYNELVNYADDYAKQIEDATAEALGDMWVLQEDIYRIKYAHDYLIDTVTYDLNAPFNQNMYSTFINRVTVCAGYARGFQYLMHKVGIPSFYVTGRANDPQTGGLHAWSMLKAYGEYYTMDVTWDDTGRPYEYSYDYFCVTDNDVANNHFRDSVSSAIPASTGVQCNYQNAFGGNYPGTDYSAIHGQLPQKKHNNSSDNSSDSKENWWEEEKTDNQMDNGDGQGWWNLLDPDWEKSDWSKSEEMEGFWEIYDETTNSYYLWQEGTNDFFAFSGEQEALYHLDMETYEWVEVE